LKAPGRTRGVRKIEGYRRRIAWELTDEERIQTRLALEFKPPASPPVPGDEKQKHLETMAMLEAEQRAFDRVIRLQKEYRAMNEEITGTDVVKPVPASDFMLVIANATRDPGIDPAKLQQLLEMAERMMKFQAERDFADAMLRCQEEIGPIAKTAENAQTGTSYAPFESIDRAIRPVYTSNGFSMSFSSGAGCGERMVKVTCDVRHSSGHTVRYEIQGELDITGPKGTQNKTSIHGLGSTLSHLKRYLTLMIWNLTLTDREQATVTREQAQTIRAMLNSAAVTGDRLQGFLKWAKAESVEKIACARYARVVEMLKAAERNNHRNGTVSSEERRAPQ
jgi:hypothetical protein